MNREEIYRQFEELDKRASLGGGRRQDRETTRLRPHDCPRTY